MNSLVEMLNHWSLRRPTETAFTFLEDGESEERTVSYRQLETRVRAIAAALQNQSVSRHVLLLFPPGLDFVEGFLGAIHAGLIPVPAYPPDPARLERSLPRLRAILEDAGATTVLSTSAVVEMGSALAAADPRLAALQWVATDRLAEGDASGWRDPQLRSEDVAFIQYTSGTTSDPRGVVLTHGNLLANQRMIHKAFGVDESSTAVGWLPLYHDMGLIGNVLGSLHAGCRCVLMSPLHFLQRPLRWLQAISRWGGTVSGGPNFAYDLCTRKITEDEKKGLDLSSWQVAFNGSEPVRADTLDRFAEAFAACGFRRRAFLPCYGMAEASLLVTGVPIEQEPRVVRADADELSRGQLRPVPETQASSRLLVGCGPAVEGCTVQVVDVASFRPLPDGEVGEIWIGGPHVAQGYWGKPFESRRDFGALLEGAGTFLRSGDLGVLHDGELFVTGRLKDMLIVRGRNHYPQDIERTVEGAHPALRRGCVAAFSVEQDGEERLMVVAEIERRSRLRRASDPVVLELLPDFNGDLSIPIVFEELEASIRRALNEEHGLALGAIALIKAGTIPKTSSGKLQRRACREAFLAGTLDVLARYDATGGTRPQKGLLDAAALRQACADKSRDSLVRHLAARVAQLTGGDESSVDPAKPVSTLGLDSLASVELAEELEGLLEVPVTAFLGDESLRDIVNRLLLAKPHAPAASRAGSEVRRREGAAEIWPLSEGQKSLWVVEELSPGGAAYNHSFCCRIRSDLDVETLEKALQALLERHPMLRASFASDEGEPIQRIDPGIRLRLERLAVGEADDAAVRAMLAERALVPFDLARGPLLRATLATRSRCEHFLLLSAHHVATDLHSLLTLLDELGRWYERLLKGGELPPAEAHDYADFIAWQRGFLAEDAAAEAHRHWTSRLAGAPTELELATDHPRPARRAFAGAVERFELSRELAERVERTARAEGVTPFVVLVSAFELLMSRFSGQTDLLVSTPVRGRPGRRFQQTVGYFVSPLLLRGELDGDTTGRQLLANNRRELLEAMRHQHYPLTRIVEALALRRDSSRNPLFQVAFALERATGADSTLIGLLLGEPGARLALGGLQLESFPLAKCAAPLDLAMTLWQSEERLSGALEYDTALFDPTTARRLLAGFERLLEQLCQAPEQTIGSFSALGETERRLVLEQWNATDRDSPRERSMCERFAEQVARAPDAEAVVCGPQRLSYRELDEHSDQLARRLLELGLRPEEAVGVALPRGLRTPVALLGILKAGGAYLGLDARNPPERQAFILRDARVRLVITAEERLAGLPETVRPVLLAAEPPAPREAQGMRALAPGEAAPPLPAPRPDQLAYVCYTSGSTGIPKGVGLTHRNVVHFVANTDWVNLGPGDTFLHASTLAFDAATIELWVPLLNGARLEVYEGDELSIDRLGHLFESGRLTHAFLTTELFHQLILERVEVFGSLRGIYFGGDAASAPLCNRLLQQVPGCLPTNLYGPTEITVAATYHPLREAIAANESVPLGHPLARARAYVLDADLRPVPVGVPGELCIGGDGVGRGYLNQPDLTAERFVPDPFDARPGRRLYRTGDRARWRADGTLEFLGRIDLQVKLRGFRIELGEVERTLAQHPDVASAVVLARQDDSTKQLVGYCVPRAGTRLTVPQLAGYLRTRLPDYMVPTAWALLERLPLMPSGKVDRKALASLPATGAASGAAWSEPRTATELAVAEMWRGLLGAARIGRHDDFFALGGHSLLAARLLARLRQTFGVELALREVFEAPTLEQLSRCIDERRAGGAPAAPALAIGRADRDRPLPLSFSQQRLWFLSRLEVNSARNNIPAAVRLAGPLDETCLAAALGDLVARHESLRTVFEEGTDGPHQRVTPAAPVPLRTVDLSAETEPERQARLEGLQTEEAQGRFDLCAGPLLRVRLVRLAANEHVLLVILHHIVSDGWSMAVFARELAAFYEARRRGVGAELAPLPIQYPDYAAWQHDRATAARLQPMLAYWKQLLAGSEILELPTDRPRPAVWSGRGDLLPVQVDAELVQKLEALGRAHGASLFMVLLASFKAVLSRLSGSSDISVGTPVANRPSPQLEGLIGFFVNTLAMRTDLSGDPSFAELLGRVRDVALEGLAHGEAPFEQVVEAVNPTRDTSRTPLFQTMLALQTIPELRLDIEGLQWQSMRLNPRTSRFDLTVDLAPGPSGLSGFAEYSTDLFDAQTVARWVERWIGVLRAVVAEPATRLSRLPMLDAAEERRVLSEWNPPDRDFPRDRTICDLFAERVARAPEAVAVVCSGKSLTYRQLDERSDALARQLLELGLRPEEVVGVRFPRGLLTPVALLGILKAGGAYLGLEKRNPPERQAFMLRDAEVRLVLVGDERITGLPDWVRTLRLSANSLLAHGARPRPVAPLRPDQLAYICYTSGSTGTPKGVAVSHRNVVQLAFEPSYLEPVRPTDTVLHSSTLAFDAATFEIWTTLLSGARVEIYESDEFSIDRVAALIGSGRITDVFLTTELFNQLVLDRVEVFRSVRRVLFGGEAASPQLCNRLLQEVPGCQVSNIYGPTETTTFAVFHPLRGGAVAINESVPLGRAIARTRAYVLDPELRPVPAGVAGELCLGGEGVTRGYLKRPDLTAERFLPDPFCGKPGRRLYRTGDRVRWRADGTLEFLGRIDLQVKLRGFRIELGEVERALLQHPDVAQTVVVARQDGATKRLVGYCVPREGASLSGAQLAAHLKALVPDYMVPSGWAVLERLPLNANGKVDRKALPVPEDTASASAWREPRTAVEQELAAIWREVLGLARVGLDDNFFDLGGHSLVATRVLTRVRQVLGVELPVLALFEAPTVARLAERMQAALSRGVSDTDPPLEHVERHGEGPASFAQERFWFLDRFEPNSAQYNIAGSVRLTGRLEPAALEKAIATIVARHESLRTVFVEGQDGVRQLVQDRRIPVPQVDLGALSGPECEREVERLIVAESERPFDLAAGPLVRMSLLRLSAEEHRLVLAMHHSISDGWSLSVMSREIALAYAACAKGEEPSLPPLRIGTLDYAAWQRERLSGEQLDRLLAYWKERLAGVEPLELPTDRARPTVFSGRGAQLPVRIDGALKRKLEALGRTHCASLFMTLLAGFQALLSRYSGQTDISIGTPVANRPLPELEGLIGCFVNTVVMRTDLSGDPSFAELLERAKATCLGAYAHEQAPFEKVVDALNPPRDTSRSPLFQAMLALQNTPAATFEVPGLRAELLRPPSVPSPFDVSLDLSPAEDGLDCRFEYATDLFDAETIERMGHHLVRLLEAVVADPTLPLSQLPLLDEAETHRVTREWSLGGEPPAERSVWDLFAEQARQTPDKDAVVFGEQRLTYRQLELHAEHLAGRLLAHGLKREEVVAVGVPRSPHMIVALLGILRAGGAYLGLDSRNPADRTAFTLRDAGVRLLVGDGTPPPGLPDGVQIVRIDAELPADAALPPPVAPPSPSQLAYVIYTSGSTGLPKGVDVRHRSVAAFIEWAREAYGIRASDRVLQFSSICWDASVEDTFGALCSGATLVLREEAMLQTAGFFERCAHHRVSVIDLPTAFWHGLVLDLEKEPDRALWPELRVTIIGGEAASPDRLAAWLDRCGERVELFNGYGPTEATVVASYCRLSREDAARRAIPIGRPIRGASNYVLDAQLRPQPIGVFGELYLGGVGVVPGYRGRADLTAERFIPDPFSTVPGARLYRSGDRVRWRRDGQLEYGGRSDDQVKLRGFRVELGEIERALAAHPDVAQAVVIVKTEGTDKRLVGYCVPRAGTTLSGAQLVEHLRTHLPDYMIPSRWGILERMPLTALGKLDRRALPAPEAVASGRPWREPESPVERSLAAIWREVLELERIGLDDDFFELGGHSLLAARVVARVNRKLGVEVPVRTLFECPTLERFCRAVEALQEPQRPAGGAPPATAIPRLSRSGLLPLSLGQERLWFLAELTPDSAQYNMPSALRLRGTLDVAALKRALNKLIARHEVLRSSFLSHHGQPFLEIQPATATLELPVRDLSALPEPEREAMVERLALEDARTPFRLSQGPLLRARLLALGPQEHVLLLTMHHIVSDGWSVGLMVREVCDALRAELAGQPKPIEELPLQYVDYAAWQRERLSAARLDALLEYWKQQLSGLEPLELPLDRPRPAHFSGRGAQVPLRLGRELTERLRTVARKHEASLFMTLLAGFQAVLSRWGAGDDIAVGSPVANRPLPELERLVGFFVNTVVMRTDLSGDPRFDELIGRVKETCLGAYAHEEAPFEKVVEAVHPARDTSRAPLFQAMFVLQNTPDLDFEVPGLRTELMPQGGTAAQYDLVLDLTPTADGLEGNLRFAADLFDASTIERMSGHLVRLLEAAAANPSTRLSRLPILDAAEERTVLSEWNATDRDYPRALTVCERFAEQVARWPDAEAVGCGEQRLTYRELDERTDALACHLLELGLRPEEVVGIALPRGLHTAVAMLGILKAGGAYLGLDDRNPPERLAFMLRDAGARLVVASEERLTRLPETVRPVLLSRVAPAAGRRPQAVSQPGQLAYVCYTSGSTGTPKAVGIAHRNLIHFVVDAEHLCPGPGDTFLHITTLAFDPTVIEIWAPLLNGARLEIYEGDEFSLERLGRLLESGRITDAQLTTELFHQLVLDRAEAFRSVRRVYFGGDTASPQLCNRLLEQAPGCLARNMYGPTEITVAATCHPLREPIPASEPVPLGHPLSRVRAYVLDPDLRPVPVGVPGELCIGGEGVGRGYLNRPELTAERFVADPYATRPGQRLYRTGDRARWRANGTLDFLGRLDSQVKLRGFRIELGEIERALALHPGVAQAVVVARQEASTKRLVGYCVPRDGASLSGAPLAAHLKASLPDYMIPTGWAVLERLPVTAHGKVDRRALPAPEETSSTRPWREPQTAVERALAAIFAEVLGLERVGADDDFFELGGHSLLAARVVARIRDRLGIDFPMAGLFEAPRLSALASRVEALAASDRAAESVPKLDRSRPLALSFGQEEMWFVEKLNPNTAQNNISAVARGRGRLDVDALRGAMEFVVRRHESLRTVFLTQDAEPRQRILPECPVVVPLVDLSTLPETEREQAADQQVTALVGAPFDLEAALPWRMHVLKLAEDDHVLVLVVHHIVSDGWSNGILTHELRLAYEALCAGRPLPALPPLPVQPADLAAWQRARLSGSSLEGSLQYWKKQLAGVEPLALPTDRARGASSSTSARNLQVFIDRTLQAELEALGREHGATLYMTLLAAFASVLARYSGREDLSIGSPVANRPSTEAEKLIGLFFNMVALRPDLGGDPTFAELLGRVRETVLGAFAHQEVPFSKVVDAVNPVRDASAISPLFNVVFVLLNTSPNALDLPGLSCSPRAIDKAGTKTFDLSLELAHERDGLRGTLEYADALFDRVTIEAFREHLMTFLRSAIARPHERLSKLALLSPQERTQVLEVFSGARQPATPAPLLHQRFLEVAAQQPDHIAVVCGEREYSYGELAAHTAHVAARLASLGVGRGARVALGVGKSAEMIAGIVGILRAGAAYVPIDPALPAERIAQVLEDSGASAIAVDATTPARLMATGLPVLRLDLREPPPPARDAGPGPATGLDPAYVIYTSGSTGTPKGVVVEHQPVARFIQWARATYRTTPQDRFLQFTSISWDTSIEEIFSTLCAGATLVLREEAMFGIGFVERCAHHRITVIDLPTAFWHTLVLALQDAPGRPLWPELRLAIIGGEAAQPERVAAWFARCGERVELFNTFGVSEASVVSCACRLGPEYAARGIVPIGTPITGSTLYVLGPEFTPQPVGVYGELCIGGAGVARGYWKRPDLTAEKFVPDPFSAAPGARLYRTGDRARWRRDGQLEYLGRGDNQIKLRGHRIELGEIETALRRQPGVKDAVVIVYRPPGVAEGELAAYVVTEPGQAADAPALLGALRGELPAYTVPNTVTFLESLPVGPTGKLDRRALPAPSRAAAQAPAGSAPKTATETALAQIWSELLGGQAVERDSDFFAIGGNSLAIIRMQSRVRAKFGVVLPVAKVYACKSLADLAVALEEIIAAAPPSAGASALPPIRPRPRAGRFPAGYMQERFFVLGQLDDSGVAANLVVPLQVEGSLDRDRLRQALAALVRRHEVLRTSLELGDTGVMQQVREEVQVELVEREVADLPDQALIEQFDRPFDLAEPPALRVEWVRTPTRQLLLFATHHAVCDGLSVENLLHDLAALYTGEALPPLACQFGDFTAWQRERVDSGRLEEQRRYWQAQLQGELPAKLNLPTDSAPEEALSFEGDEVRVELSKELAATLEAVGRAESVGLGAVCFAAYSALLHALTDAPASMVGTVSEGRSCVELEPLVGMFINFLAIKAAVPRDGTLRDLVRQTGGLYTSALANQDLPFPIVDKLAGKARDLFSEGLFETQYVFHPPERARQPRIQIGDAILSVARREAVTATFDLKLDTTKRADGGVLLSFQYRSALFRRTTIEAFARVTALLLESLALDPDQPMSVWLERARAQLPAPARAHRSA